MQDKLKVPITIYGTPRYDKLKADMGELVNRITSLFEQLEYIKKQAYELELYLKFVPDEGKTIKADSRKITVLCQKGEEDTE